MIKIKVNAGEEVIETVTKFATEKNIKNASLSVIGGVEGCKISTMPKEDAKKVIEKEYAEPLELTGTGEIEDGKVHIHAVFGRADQTALAGHLEWAKVKTWYVNVYVTPLS